MDESSPYSRFSEDVEHVLNFHSHIRAASQKAGAEFVTQFIDYVHLFQELLYCHIVDCYLRFLTEALSALYAFKPEMIRSNEKVTVEFILNHDSMPELVNSLIERKVTALAYESTKSLAQYFENTLKLPLFTSDEEFETAIIAIEVRNLFVHNRGIVNRIFQDRAASLNCRTGDRLELSTELVAKHGGVLLTAASRLSARIGEKFGCWF
jgi:hypothetical protein